MYERMQGETPVKVGRNCLIQKPGRASAPALQALRNGRGSEPLEVVKIKLFRWGQNASLRGA